LYDDLITMPIARPPASGKTLAPASAAGGGGTVRLETSRLSDRLAALIEKQIDGESLVPGDRLPTEQQLATAHGVSRTVVREAIHQLKSQGLVRSRQGSGVYVTEPPAYRKLAFGPQVLESMEAVVQVVELRRVIEGEMAALAAQRATAAQCKALMRALAAIDTATSSGQLGLDEDLAFHRAIGAATGNPQFVRLLAVLEEHLRDQMSVTKGNEAKHVDMMAAVRREHRAIVDAIAAGNPKAARAASIEHHLNGEHRLIAVGAIKPKRAARRAA
jgi:GntR family transcriptional regulator, transcriptional repressor for pyruvate dehydrogenase complex